MSNKEIPEIVYSEYIFCIRGEDLKFFDKTDFRIFKEFNVKILPFNIKALPIEDKNNVK